MMRMSILFFVLFWVVNVNAQKSVTVDVSSDSVETGDVIELKYSLENLESKFSLPDLSDFEVISGPSVATSMSIINGVKSQKEGYTLYLQMDTEGSFIIPGFELKEGENTITVPDITVKVFNIRNLNENKRGNRIARQRAVSVKIIAGENDDHVHQPKTARKLRKL
jgi:hypothetical protein